GQTAAAPRDDDRDRVQARAAPAVRGARGRGVAAERAARARPARRGRIARHRRQGPGSGDDDPHRAHGLPLRGCLSHWAAGGLRAADPRRDARRRDAVHSHRRGRGAVVARRRDRRRVGARPAGIPELSGRDLGAAVGGRIAWTRRAVMAQALTSVREIERGLPPFGAEYFEGLVDVVDRLIVDSTEWPNLPDSYRGLSEIFDRVAVSDIAWARTSRWRPMLASLWPQIADVERIRVTGTAAQAHLLAGWLRSRLKRDVVLEHDQADRLEGVDIDGEPAPFPPGHPPAGSDLLSEELDKFGRDRMYEDAVRNAGGGT